MCAHAMIGAHPEVRGNTSDAPFRCNADCRGCAQSCTRCADARIAEHGAPQLERCIRLTSMRERSFANMAGAPGSTIMATA